MKLSYFQIETHLAKNLAPVYLVSGEDPLLKLDIVNLLRKTAKNAGFIERVKFPIDASINWEELHSVLYASSFLAEKQLIELDFRDTLPPKDAGKILSEYAAAPSPDHLLIIDLPKVDDKIAKSAWFQALEKLGVHVAIWPIPREQLPQWLIQRAKRYKMQLDMRAANLLSDHVEGNLVAAAQVIEKLYLLNAAQPITTQIVTDILQDESRFTVFDLMEALLAGNSTRALHILETLKEDGTEPILVLWAITRELRMLIDMINQKKAGQPFDALCKKHRIFSTRQSLVRQFLNKTNLPQLFDLLQVTVRIDQMIKGATPGNPWESLQLFALRWV